MGGLERRVGNAAAPLAGCTDMLEVHESPRAFERIETWLRDEGFSAPGGETLVADLYVGYWLSRTIRRTPGAAPPEPRPLPLAACAVRPAAHDVGGGNDATEREIEIGGWGRAWPEADHAATPHRRSSL